MALTGQQPVRLLLEIPVNTKDARRFEAELTLSRLVLTLPCGSRGPYSEFARLIEALRPPELSTFVSPIGSFVSFNELSAAVDGRSIALVPEPALARTSTMDGTQTILRTWRSEVLVIMFANDRTAKEVAASVQASKSRWWAFARSGYEGPYLKHIRVCDPMIFFSETRSSLELIGTEAQIRRAFDTACGVIG